MYIQNKSFTIPIIWTIFPAVPSIRNPGSKLKNKRSRYRNRSADTKTDNDRSTVECGNDSGVSLSNDCSLLDESVTSSSGGALSGNQVKKTADLELRIKELEQQLQERDIAISVLQDQNEQQKKRVADLEKLSRDLTDVRETHIIEKSRELLSSKLTRNQSDLLLGVKKRVNWSNEELSRGFTLRFFGLPGYDYLTKNLGMPFPRSSCLRQYASRMDMRQGFLNEVLQMLKAKSQSMSEFERVCVLLYDEMSVSEVYEYDRKHDDVLGPHTKVQVKMTIN